MFIEEIADKGNQGITFTLIIVRIGLGLSPNWNARSSMIVSESHPLRFQRSVVTVHVTQDQTIYEDAAKESGPPTDVESSTLAYKNTSFR